ncbi:MAG: hypothetical protein F6K62_27620, partial [Sphaerospermopsis sp. SIO1G2]|nr:hypothetical protein [Sphaerospermopsis sp. SIO1G2]
MSISQKFSSRAARMEPAAIRAVMGRMTPDCISFGAGKPAQHLFPLDAVAQQTGKLLEEHGGDALQYSATKGYEPLRAWAAGRVSETTTADDVCIVSGSQQAIDMVSKVFVDPGDRVIVEAPT